MIGAVYGFFEVMVFLVQQVFDGFVEVGTGLL